MSMIIPVDEALVQLRWQANGTLREQVVTLGIRPLSPATIPNLICSLVDAAAVSAGLAVAANISNQYSWKGTRCIKMTSTGGTPGVFNNSIAGTGSINPVPINAALLVKKQTALGGRKYQGRMYVPPAYISEVNIGSTGNFSGSDLTLWQAKWTSFFTELNSRDVSPVLLHGFAGPSTTITAFSCDGLMATQRRRMR